MQTIIEYIEKYKNTSIQEYPWNEMDNLLCAIISYIPALPFTNTRTFDELCSEVLKYKMPKKTDLMTPVASHLFELLKDNTRYSKMYFENFERILDETTQFAAISCYIDDIKVISFKGTDNTTIGWLENFRMMYEYPTFTQKKAIDYLNDNISGNDKSIYVVGHSKGGNLAMVSAMELPISKFKKIKNVFNFDGPGLRFNEYNSLKYERLCIKLINILPNNSFVGVLLYNENYTLVKSNLHAFNVHYPNSWDLNKQNYKLSVISKKLHELTTTRTESLDDEKVKEVFETIFTILNERRTSRFNITLNDVLKAYNKVRVMDKEASKYFYQIIKVMLNIKSRGQKLI